MSEKLYLPIHLGEIFMEEFIEGFGITRNKPAVLIGVPSPPINVIVQARSSVKSRYGPKSLRYVR